MESGDAEKWGGLIGRILGRLSTLENNDGELGQINAEPKFNLLNTYKNLYSDDPTSNPYYDIQIESEFFDQTSLINKFKNSLSPIYLSLNVQSLASKYEKLKNFILELSKGGVLVEAVAIQETWQIINPDLFQIPGFKLFYKTRAFSRGGGVFGFK